MFYPQVNSAFSVHKTFFNSCDKQDKMLNFEYDFLKTMPIRKTKQIKKRQRKMGQMLTMTEQSGGRELIHPHVLNFYAVVLFILEIKKKMPFIFCNGGWRYFKASKK